MTNLQGPGSGSWGSDAFDWLWYHLPRRHGSTQHHKPVLDVPPLQALLHSKLQTSRSKCALLGNSASLRQHTADAAAGAGTPMRAARPKPPPTMAVSTSSTPMRSMSHTMPCLAQKSSISCRNGHIHLFRARPQLMQSRGRTSLTEQLPRCSCKSGRAGRHSRSAAPRLGLFDGTDGAAAHHAAPCTHESQGAARQ
jgi:hypothetical protein